MDIKEVVEQIRKIARVENGEILIGRGLEREMNELTYYIIAAILNGYTLCKVDEAVEKIENNRINETFVDSSFYTAGKCIEIIKEACK